MKHAPSQQGRTPQYAAAATPGASASTPYSNLHAAFSPHGSRLSPQQVKKSPATSAGPAGVAMVPSGSSAGAALSAPPMNFDSPSAAAFNSMLGMGSFDASLDNMGMGVGGITIPRPSGDEERQKRLDEIIQTLSVRAASCVYNLVRDRANNHFPQQNKGIVSEEGLERLVKRFGLDVLWDDRDSLRILIIAGATFTLEIGLKEHRVQTVELQYALSGPEVTKHTKKAEAILFENLKLAPGQHPWTKKLDDFASNLEPMARLDKLSLIDDKGTPIMVTYDAIAGLVGSLLQLHEWDVQKLREEPTYSQKPEEHVRTIAMCERNGRPFVNERGIMGMGLDYWRDRRYHIPSPSRAEQWYKDGKLWSILVSCAARNPMEYPSAVRVSTNWIGDEIEVAATDGLPSMINWQQPPDSVLPEKPGDELLLTGPKLPEVMFTAVLNPPVTLPITEWEQIHHFTGAHPSHPAFMQTFDYLIFPVDGAYNPTESRTVQASKSVHIQRRDKTFGNVNHDNRLFIHKPVYGQTLTELPFSHPSQLVNMLPTLRQYAFLWNLLNKAFSTQSEQAAASNGATPNGSQKITARSDDFDDFMHDDKNDTEHNVQSSSAVKVDVTLNAHPLPNPKLQIMFPFRGRPAQVTVDIGRNAVVQIESTNVVSDDGVVLDESGQPLPGAVPEAAFSRHRLERMLMFFEDIDLWCEWIRNHVGPPE